MPTPILDVFRFRKEPTESFSYLGAIWTIEIKPASDGGHWECATTAPVNMMLAIAEDEKELRRAILESGMATLRKTERWYLCEHLTSIGLVERLTSATATSRA